MVLKLTTESPHLNLLALLLVQTCRGTHMLHISYTKLRNECIVLITLFDLVIQHVTTASLSLSLSTLLSANAIYSSQPRHLYASFAVSPATIMKSS